MDINNEKINIERIRRMKKRSKNHRTISNDEIIELLNYVHFKGNKLGCDNCADRIGGSCKGGGLGKEGSKVCIQIMLHSRGGMFRGAETAPGKTVNVLIHESINGIVHAHLFGTDEKALEELAIELSNEGIQYKQVS